MPKQSTDDAVHGGADVADVGDGAGDGAGVGGQDQRADGGAESLVGLFRQHGGKFPGGHRAYRVRVGGVVRFAFSKSPGQAALAVCEVERVKDRELTVAAFEAMGARMG